MKTLRSAALLALSLPTALIGPIARADAPTPTASFPALEAPLVPGSAAAALDALAGKPQIVGITTKSGAMFLGRVISGDHTNYLVQAFHFVGRPRTVSRTVGSGRGRRVVRAQEPTFIPDIQAVGYLLQGLAGSKVNPPEVLAGPGMLAASDIKWLQAVSPPTKAARKAAERKASAAASSLTASLPASAASTPPAAGSSPAPSTTAPASPWAWTVTTLWPPAAAKK